MLVHRLLHASEVMPLGRSHLFHCLQCLRDVNRLEGHDAVLSDGALKELEWWIAALVDIHSYELPLASRSLFPCDTEPGVLTHYGDASREVDEDSGEVAESSGFGAWCVILGTFFYIEERWLPDECRAYSINVLELATEIFGASAFVEKAAAMGVEISNIHTFVDNTCAENVSERGRTQSEALNQLNQRRHQMLRSSGLHQRTSRVASVFNDVADLLSRGDVEEALRFPRDALLPCVRLPVDSVVRSMAGIVRTWA